MMRQMMTYGTLALVAALIGFMIGGGPGALQSAPAASIPAPAPSATSTTVSPEDELDVETAAVDAAVPSTESVSSSSRTSSSTTSSSTTSSSTTTAPPLTTTTAAANEPRGTSAREVDRSAIEIGVANASRAVGAAGRVVDRLTALGYTSTAPFDAADASETLVYHTPELVSEAEQLARDLGLTTNDVRLLTDAPELFTSRDFGIVVVLGFEAGGEIPA